MDATCGVITTFGKSWNGRWNGRPCFASGYVHQVSRAARNLGWDFKWSNRSSSAMSLPRAMFTRIASSFICAKKRRLTIPRVSRVKGRARTTASADLVRTGGDVFGRREAKRHRMLRDRDVVGPRVAAHDGARGEAFERQMVHAGDERLDQPDRPCSCPEVRRKFAGESHGDDHV